MENCLRVEKIKGRRRNKEAFSHEYECVTRQGENFDNVVLQSEVPSGGTYGLPGAGRVDVSPRGFEQSEQLADKADVVVKVDVDRPRAK
jgi:hypothetical protein